MKYFDIIKTILKMIVVILLIVLLFVWILNKNNNIEKINISHKKYISKIQINSFLIREFSQHFIVFSLFLIISINNML